jgi:hypothetical protein
LDAHQSDKLGKYGNKLGIKLFLRLGDAGKLGISQDDIRGMLKNVGKGLDIDQRVEVEFSH